LSKLSRESSPESCHRNHTLEIQVAQRTEALRIAHSEMLAKTRLATIGQTAAMLAHAMRNPLASIKLALSALAGSRPSGTGRVGASTWSSARWTA
jgi:C4-dicarboxylate-specific signal transduction histidine kinase